jgi:hypothetical protein
MERSTQVSSAATHRKPQPRRVRGGEEGPIKCRKMLSRSIRRSLEDSRGASGLKRLYCLNELQADHLHILIEVGRRPTVRKNNRCRLAHPNHFWMPDLECATAV